MIRVLRGYAPKVGVDCGLTEHRMKAVKERKGYGMHKVNFTVVSRDPIIQDPPIKAIAPEMCKRYRLKGFTDPRLDTLFSEDAGGSIMKFTQSGDPMYFNP